VIVDTVDAPYVDAVREAAEEGGAIAADLFRTDLPVETKGGKTDYVTPADRRAQRRIVEVLDGYDPDAVVVGEENDARREVPEEGFAWVIDPIDGTNNYVRGMRHWSTCVAALEDGEPVAAANALPALGDTYVAGIDSVERNGDPVTVSARTDPETFVVAPTLWWGPEHRGEYAAATEAIVTRFGDLVRLKSVQTVLALVAAGSIEGAITNVRANPWDSVGGVYMIRRAGGTVTDLEGDRWRHDSRGLVASNGTAHGDVLAAAREITQ
jgi:myo-inositol-1(or 4)-monophosphatase